MSNFLPLAAACALLAVPATAQSVVNSFEVLPSGSAFVGGLAYDSSTDHLWVADSTNDQVSEYDRAGNLIQQIAASSTQVIGVACDPASDSVWVSDENEMVYEYSKSTGMATGFSFSASPYITDMSSAAFDTDTGTLWFSQDSGTRVAAEFDTAGGYIRTVDLTAAGSTDPDGLAFNTVTNTLLLGEDLGDQVLEVDLSGNLLGSWQVTDPIYGLISPEGLAIDNAGGKLFIGGGLSQRRVFEVDGIVAAAPTGPTLAVNGPCPGPATADASGMTPGGPVVFYYGTSAGSFTVPGGPCAGLTVGVAIPTRLGSVFFADGAGNVSLAGNQGANACGNVMVGAVDVATCTSTNLVTL